MAKKTPTPRKRLPQAEREAQIIRDSIPFFASRGFSAPTRDLAEHLGIHQSLLYQYFPSKDDLIDRLYREMILGRWKREWEDWLRDREVPLKDRLERFFRAFTDGIFSYDYMRFFFLAWMDRPYARDHYSNPVQARVFRIISSELRHETGLPDHDAWPMSAAELEMHHAFQSSIFYYGVRQFIYGVTPRMTRDEFITQQVELFLAGAPIQLRAMARAQNAPDS
jgi:AcrR family transcriptional regulator